jgi:hypothetical protein
MLNKYDKWINHMPNLGVDFSNGFALNSKVADAVSSSIINGVQTFSKMADVVKPFDAKILGLNNQHFMENKALLGGVYGDISYLSRGILDKWQDISKTATSLLPKAFEITDLFTASMEKIKKSSLLNDFGITTNLFKTDNEVLSPLLKSLSTQSKFIDNITPALGIFAKNLNALKGFDWSNINPYLGDFSKLAFVDGNIYFEDICYDNVDLSEQAEKEIWLIKKLRNIKEFIGDSPVVWLLILIFFGVPNFSEAIDWWNEKTVTPILNQIQLAQGKSKYVYIQTSKAKIYENPNSRSNVVLELLENDKLQVLEEQAYWYKIAINFECILYEGWIDKQNVSEQFIE